jgi:hypothetical protein
LKEIFEDKKQLLEFILNGKIHFEKSETHATCLKERKYCIFCYFTGRTADFFDGLYQTISASQQDDYKKIINWYTFIDFELYFRDSNITLKEIKAYLLFKVSDSENMNQIISREKTAIINNNPILKKLNDALCHMYLYRFNPETGLAFQYLIVRGPFRSHGNTGFCNDHTGCLKTCPYVEYKEYTIAKFQEVFNKEYLERKYNEFNIEHVKQDYYMKHIYIECSHGPEL